MVRIRRLLASASACPSISTVSADLALVSRLALVRFDCAIYQLAPRCRHPSNLTYPFGYPH
jgi:hypothetical protein